MRRLAWLFVWAFALASAEAGAQQVAGRYRLADGPDVASELLVRSDGHFQYMLMAGALDEYAEGHWSRTGETIQLFTDPKPVPATFSADRSAQSEQESLSLLVAWPDGRGIAGIDFRIGFDTGAPIAGYTQSSGWSLSSREKRVPLWIELIEPIHGIVSTRFQIDLDQGNALHFTLTPNDIEIFDFQGTALDISPDTLVMHRNGGTLKYVRMLEEAPINP